MVDVQTYARVFKVDKQGQEILKELLARFYDVPSYTKGDPYETAFKEGQRSVIAYLNNKIKSASKDQQ